MLHILKFSCAVWLGILFGLLHVSLQKRIELPHREQIHGSGLLACRAYMLAFFLFLPLSYICLFFFFFLKEKKPLLHSTSVILGALSLQIGKPSYKITHIFFF